MARRGLAAGDRWAIVLAGGEGTRLSRWTMDLFGEHRPKQYCAFLGSGSMFDHTMRRAVCLVGAQRVVTVIGAGHMRYLSSSRDLNGFIVEQPVNRDTAAGVFLPLTYVMAYDPEATVVIFPSDHFIRPNARFLACMDRAARLVEARQDRMALASAVADRPETEYGWIQPGEPAGPFDAEARVVSRFHEKPDEATARAFYAQGFLWNTLNMAVKAKTLWSLGWGYFPEMLDRFDVLRRAVGTPEEGRVLARIYEGMPLVNFSRGILERAASRAVVLPMTGVEWSDWGRPERILETLGRLAPAAAPCAAPARAAAAPALTAAAA